MSRLKFIITIGTAATTLIFGSTVVSARDTAVGPSTYAVIVHHADVHPRSQGAAHAILGRLGDAALEACGASSFSLREVRLSTEGSKCWKDSMADVVARIGDPMIQAAYERKEHRSYKSAANNSRSG